ncbi:MAG: hypothetical protein DCF22_15265 [Leptolyngbya sp.]|nr:MAG: hypothetical protein DCF22_15265 [Leptolyngbya sp.]
MVVPHCAITGCRTVINLTSVRLDPFILTWAGDRAFHAQTIGRSQLREFAIANRADFYYIPTGYLRRNDPYQPSQRLLPHTP